MKYLGIDYGQKRTGIAVTDAGGLMAFPRRTIHMRGKEAFFAELLQLAEAEGVEAFVIGLPVRQDGTDSETTRQVRNMAARLRRRTSLPIYFMEETLSSWEAQIRLREAASACPTAKKRGKSTTGVPVRHSGVMPSGVVSTGEKRKSGKAAERLDQAAAVLILETFLAGAMESRIPL